MPARPSRPADPARSPARPPDEREAGQARVSCGRCGAAVLAAKFSPRHTSVQWTAVALAACAEFGTRTAAGEQTALIDGCASLRASIDAAVQAGGLRLAAPHPAGRPSPPLPP
jgi:hypothetical protein